MAFRLGIDLGGTKIEAVIIDEQFQVVKRKRVPTNREEGYEAIIETIISLSKSMIDGYEEFEGPIGICTPGTIEAETGLLKNSNTVCLIGKPIQKDMESELGIPVLMENDANCFALAEATLGAAKKYNVVFGVILGTGCGGGITMLKNIHRGANRIAGEWGHHCLHPGGRDCYCGNKGCVEAYISGTALEKEWYKITGVPKESGAKDKHITVPFSLDGVNEGSRNDQAARIAGYMISKNVNLNFTKFFLLFNNPY